VADIAARGSRGTGGKTRGQDGWRQRDAPLYTGRASNRRQRPFSRDAV